MNQASLSTCPHSPSASDIHHICSQHRPGDTHPSASHWMSQYGLIFIYLIENTREKLSARKNGNTSLFFAHHLTGSMLLFSSFNARYVSNSTLIKSWMDFDICNIFSFNEPFFFSCNLWIGWIRGPSYNFHLLLIKTTTLIMEAMCSCKHKLLTYHGTGAVKVI